MYSARSHSIERGSIWIRFSLLLLVLVLLITGLSVLLTSWFTYRNEIARLQRELMQIQQSHVPAIVSSLWLTDYRLVQEQVDAIARFPHVARVEVEDDEGQRFAAGSEDIEELSKYREPLTYRMRGSAIEVGSLTMYADEPKLRQTAVRAALFSLISHLAIAVMVSLVIAVLFRKLLGSHLERLTRRVQERDVLLGEVQHRVKNTMNTMVSMLSLQAGTLRDPDAVAALKDAMSRFRSMEVLYDQLYRSGSHDSGSIKKYLPQLVNATVGLFPSSAMVTVSIEIEDVELDVKRLSTLGMIVNELVTNAMKYALRDQSDGRLLVAGHRDQSRQRLIVAVEDNGPGMPDTFDRDKQSGFGLTMVKALAQQLRGTLRLERNGGTRVVLEFDL